MPVAKTKLAKQSQKHFKWYVAIILVALVAIAGILIIRFSHASTAYADTITSTFTYPLPTHDIAINVANTGHWDCYDKNCQKLQGSTRICANISYQGYINYNLSKAYLPAGSGVTISETGSGPAASYSCTSYK